jgi:hypothetical protein
MVVLAGAAWERALGDLLTSSEARDLLGGISREALRKRVVSGSVIALRDDGGLVRYPRWQFDTAAGAPFRVVKELNEIFSDAALDSWTVASFATTPQSELGDRAPGRSLRRRKSRAFAHLGSPHRGRPEALIPRGLPAPPDDLPELPSANLGPRPLWRIHPAAVAPWHFDVGPDGRFNLAEAGTCYLAEAPIGAFVEKFGRLLRPGGVIPEPLVDAQRLSRLRPPRTNIVDLTDPRVLGLVGLTAEIHSTPDYDLTQGWALALQEAGYGGIRYRARHDPRAELNSVALFGSGRLPGSAAKTTTIPVDLIHEASATFAITVLPRRHSRRR